MAKRRKRMRSAEEFDAEGLTDAELEGGDDSEDVETSRVDPEGVEGDDLGVPDEPSVHAEPEDSGGVVAAPEGAVAPEHRSPVGAPDFVGRVRALLANLFVADLWPGDTFPAESWNYVEAALRSTAKEGRFAPHRAALEAHRLYFPMLGDTRTRAAIKEAQRTHSPLPEPPPGHGMFTIPLEYVVVNDTQGPRMIQNRIGDEKADNVIGLARCIVPGILGGQGVSTIIGAGAGVAALTHIELAPRNFGGWLAAFTYYWLRSGHEDIRDAAKDAIRAIGNLGVPKVQGIHEEVLLGEMDATGLPVTDFITARQAAIAFGAYYIAGMHMGGIKSPVWARSDSKPARALRPIMFPFSTRKMPDTDTLEGTRAVQLADELVGLLHAKGLLDS